MKHGCPRWQQSPNMAKPLSPRFWPRPTPRGMWCQWSVRNPWMNLQSKFGYCKTIQTLNIALLSKRGRNYGRTDDPNTRCPPWTFQAGGIKIQSVTSSFLTSKVDPTWSNSFSHCFLRDLYLFSSVDDSSPVSSFSCWSFWSSGILKYKLYIDSDTLLWKLVIWMISQTCCSLYMCILFQKWVDVHLLKYISTRNFRMFIIAEYTESIDICISMIFNLPLTSPCSWSDCEVPRRTQASQWPLCS